MITCRNNSNELTNGNNRKTILKNLSIRCHQLFCNPRKYKQNLSLAATKIQELRTYLRAREAAKDPPCSSTQMDIGHAQ